MYALPPTHRLRSTGLVAALLAGLGSLSAVPAIADAPAATTALAVYGTNDINHNVTQGYYDAAAAGQTVTLTQTGGQLQLDGARAGAGSSSARITPPTDGGFVAGATYAIANTARAGVAGVALPCSVTSGSLTVSELATDSAGAVTQLAASYVYGCSNGDGSGAAELRYRASNGYEALRVPGSVSFPDAGAGSSRTVTVTYSNAGNRPVTIGTASTSSVNAGLSLTIGNDHCSGAVLQPAAACTLDLTAVNDSAPQYQRALLDLPTDTAEGTYATIVLANSALPPLAPTAQVHSGYDGISVTGVFAGSQNGNPPPTATALRIFRVNGDGSTALIQELQRPAQTTATLAFTDPLAPGTTGTYRVVAVGPGGESPASNDGTATVPSSPVPAEGPINALAVVGNVAPGALSPSSSVVTTLSVLEHGFYGTTLLGQSGPDQVLIRLTYPADGLAPGDYATTDSGDGARVVGLSLNGPGACATGTLHVVDAAIKADGTPQVLTASFTNDCGGQGEIRVRSTTGYAAVGAAPAGVSAGSVAVGATSTAKTVQVKNTGSQSVTVTSAPTTRAPWSVSASTCTAALVLAPAATCSVSVRVTPTAVGDAPGLLDVPVSTPHGHLQVGLAATGTSVPSAPQSLTVALVVGHGRLTWSPPATTGGQDVTGYTVTRTDGGGAAVVVARPSAATLSYEDRALTVGHTYTYSVTATNSVGTGPAARTSGTAAPSREVLVAAAGPNDWAYSVAGISDAGGQRLPLVTDADADMPTVTRNGDFVAFVDDSSEQVRIAPRKGGPSRPITANVSAEEPAFSPDGATVIYTNVAAGTPNLELAIVGASSPTSAGVRGGSGLSRASFLPDGRSVIASRSSSDPTIEQLVLATGSTTVLTHGIQPQVSRDGKAIAFVRVTSATSDGVPTQTEIWTMPLGGTPVRLASPAGVNLLPSWAPDGKAVYFEHSAGTEAADVYRATLSPIAVTNVTASADVDELAPTVYDADVTAPKVTLTAPSLRVTLTGTTRVTYSATDSETGVGTYDVRYRRSHYDGGYTGYTYQANFQNLKSAAVTYTQVPGYDACFSVRARDRAGNVSAWTAEKCTASPLDDNRLHLAGGARATTVAGTYRGTLTVLQRAGANVWMPSITMKRGSLIAGRCPTCGSVSVYVAGRLLGTVNLAYRSTVRQAVVALPGAGTLRTGQLVIKATSSKLVQIDGLVVLPT
ncbi:MAG: hypothetical protein JWO12_1507 [Frankiales bacterium]|nr:hypothetical protein [Frankiales bacterium]